MKSLIFAIVLILSINIYAQGETENLNLFVRVYNLQGEKINKGKLIAVTEKSLQIKGTKGVAEIDYSSIGFIRTKRSEGKNVLIGSILGASAMAIFGAASADPDALFFAYTSGEGAAGGALLGLPLGAAAGGISILFKNSKYYSIDGDLLKWKLFKEMITERNN